MKVLIIGGGGREHAIAVSMKKSRRVDKLYCVPGNAGIAEIAECEPSIGVMEFDKIVAYAKEKQVDLVFVAPDDPLVGGLVDVLKEAGFRVFGPDKKAAILEGSKAFSKDLMKKYNIPTAAYETFDDPEKALAYLETAEMPIVLKADGLALGKGVLICNTLEEARAGVKEIMLDKHFGSAGNRQDVKIFRQAAAGDVCDNHENEKGNDTQTAGEAVKPVAEVDGIGGADQNKHGKGDVEPAQVKRQIFEIGDGQGKAGVFRGKI